MKLRLDLGFLRNTGTLWTKFIIAKNATGFGSGYIGFEKLDILSFHLMYVIACGFSVHGPPFPQAKISPTITYV